MAQGVAALMETLGLENLEQNLFRGKSPNTSWQRVYGGQVIGQALVAACRTVEGRLAHSLHGYFMRPGDPNAPIIYEVDRLRDGKSFTTRFVRGIQHGQNIFALLVSFHNNESEGLEHAMPMPKVPMPEDVPSEAHLTERFMASVPERVRDYWQQERAIELRPVDRLKAQEGLREDMSACFWIRATGTLPDDPLFHQCVLAYASDMTILDTATVPHNRSIFDPTIQAASLDHALWFHRPFRADDWLLYVQDTPSASGARGFARGLVYTRDGVLVASVAQEGLMRV